MTNFRSGRWIERRPHVPWLRRRNPSFGTTSRAAGSIAALLRHRCIKELPFDRWIGRWLVVETGNWLSGRKVLLPLSALGKPDKRSRRFPVALTMQQVKDSKDIDTDQPVSRQMESHFYDYYGWDPYWSGNYFPLGGVMATPVVAPLHTSRSKPREHVGADPKPDEGDPHLRSIAAVTGYHIHATDGEIGHVEDFLVDGASWSIRYITVDTKNWWPGKRVLISPRSVRQIDWADRLIQLDVDRQNVKDAPPYDPAATVDGACHVEFLIY